MNLDDLIYEKREHVAWITINRPERLNAFDFKTIGELGVVLEDVGGDRSIGVVVITGSGDRAFCTGGYLGDLAGSELDLDKVYTLFHKAFETLLRIRRLPQPVIAAVNGFAVGGGNELVVACDLAVASDQAIFGQTGPKIGSAPVIGGTNMLGLQIGDKKAKEVCFLCRQYTAAQALELGWVNAVVPHARLREEVERWCEEILDKSPLYLEIAKLSSNVWWDLLYPSFVSDLQMLRQAVGSPQMVEGATAFLERRKPDFRKFRTGTSRA
jgi:2-ketocyclohexanecarboxyl-CoA hydrolase